MSATRPRDGLRARGGVKRQCGGNPDGDAPSRGSEPWRREGSSATAARVSRDTGRHLDRNFLGWPHRVDSNASRDQPDEAIQRVGRLSSGKSRLKNERPPERPTACRGPGAGPGWRTPPMHPSPTSGQGSLANPRSTMPQRLQFAASGLHPERRWYTSLNLSIASGQQASPARLRRPSPQEIAFRRLGIRHVLGQSPP